ncbi:MAG: 30S ribosomal protein S20 [Eubacteriales bacterium]|nr:30S ribosomal protein S20 [Eubacteriales bacterium]MDD4422670.1 30S ribosomal protein S20 [Eubacteriales bacterium]
MPNIKSAKKRVKVIDAKTLQNKMFKTSLKTTVKKYKAALAEGNKELASKTYLDAVSKIDKAVSKGIIHKNNAARKKSQYTLMLNNMA